MFTDLIEQEFTQQQTDHPDGHHSPADPVRHRGIGVRYERRLNLGNFESVVAGISLWVLIIPEEMRDERGLTQPDKYGHPLTRPISLYECRQRVRELARNNIRAQFNQARNIEEPTYLGLPPSPTDYDPLLVKSVLLSLKLKRNLGDYASVEPEYTDHCDLRDIYLAYEHVHTANSTGLHIHLYRIWQSLWANIENELARAQGMGATEAELGLPSIEIDPIPENETSDDTVPIAIDIDPLPFRATESDVNLPPMPANGKLLLPPP